MMVLAIDPGTTESAYVFWDGETIGEFEKIPNKEMMGKIINEWQWLAQPGNFTLVVEQIRSYGNAIGQSVLDTVFWSGRFCEAWGGRWELMPRMEVKKHICHNHQAKDSNVIQALVDRFAYDQPNKGKGTVKAPGFFHGFSKDVWQAFALAVAWYDQNQGGE